MDDGMITHALREKQLTEAALPAVMFMLCHESLARRGDKIRQDVVILTERAARATLHELDPLFRGSVAEKAADFAHKVLSAPNSDDARKLWVACAHAILKAANRGVQINSDVLLIAVAVETLLIDEAEDFGGMPLMEEYADRMDNEARRLGFWGQIPVH